MRYAWVLSPLLFAACTLPATPEPPTIPEPPQTQTVFLSSPVECIDVIQVATIIETPAPVPKPSKRPGKPLTPVQLVAEAQKTARVEPSERGYFGGSAEQVYIYQPGKVYSIYLTPKHSTGIFLPPGERQTTSMYLDPDAFDIKEGQGGQDLAAYGAIMIHPNKDSGEVDTVILTESGRRYLLHLVIGQVGMHAVSFEIPAVVHAQEPKLILPRPPQ